MNSISRLVAVVVGLILLLNVTPSLGQPVCDAPGCNPTVSGENFNTAGGTYALSHLVLGPMGGFKNTAFGFEALFNNSTGSDNTASGLGALFTNTTGVSNTASGQGALFTNSTGSFNTASGDNALVFNSTGNLNTATGFQALENNTAGSNNTAVGAKALKKSLGTKNIAIGFRPE